MSDEPLAKTPLIKAKPLAAQPEVSHSLCRARPLSDTDTIQASSCDTLIQHRADDVIGPIRIRVDVAAPRGASSGWGRFSGAATFTSCLGQLIIQESPGWTVSMVAHMLTLVTMAMVTVAEPVAYKAQKLLVTSVEEEKVQELKEVFDAAEPTTLDENLTQAALAYDSLVERDRLDMEPSDEPEAAPAAVDLTDIGLAHVPRSDLLTVIGSFGATGLSGRGFEARSRLLTQEGGNEESERAVQTALKWIASHQLVDGGWNFNHAACPTCRGQCRNPGSMGDARNGATALAILPFLGRNETHKEGKYKPVIRRGLTFLLNHMQGGSLNEPETGKMYSHGLAAIVLCEAYAMTHDEDLLAPAQAALNFIAYAQDPNGGGWRYQPREPGDTSVVGWQLMALKSGHMAELNVSPLTIHRASLFLDSVESDEGAAYGYLEPGAGEATTAIGLLCRMYLGWKKDNEALQRGVKTLCSRGPSGGNMYYNYYATQVLRHWQGEEWDNWNRQMRDQLVHAQAKQGHEEGSWFTGVGDNGAAPGGRLYCTAMAAMILEVYYRHLPLYREQSVEQDFPE